MAIQGVNGSPYTYDNSLPKSAAAQNPAGVGISESMEKESSGLLVGAGNAKQTNDLLKTAEGGLNSIHDSLQRMREIAVQASNSAVYSASDLRGMQEEVDQLKKSITDAAKGTEYNTIKLLDGSYENRAAAVNPDGTGSKISIASATLEALGIEDFDVTGKFNMKDLDDAIEKVSESRSQIGARSNGLEHVTANNERTAENLNVARGDLDEEDMFKRVSESKKEEILKEYEAFDLKSQREQEQNMMKRLMGSGI